MRIRPDVLPLLRLIIFYGVMTLILVGVGKSTNYLVHQFGAKGFEFPLFQMQVAIGIIGLYLLFTVLIEKASFRETAIFPTSHWFGHFLRGVVFGAILILSVLLLCLATGAIHLSPKLLTLESIVKTIATVLVANFFVAIWEEIAFRGYIFKSLARAIGAGYAVLLTAIVFGLGHVFSYHSWAIGISTAIAGTLLTFAFVRSGSLYFAMGIHFAWNFLRYIFCIEGIFSITHIYPLLSGERDVEEGLFSVFISVVGIWLLLRWRGGGTEIKLKTKNDTLS